MVTGATVQVPPRSGFKRYQLDKLAFSRDPEPRVLTYAARRHREDRDHHLPEKGRLRAAHSEVFCSPVEQWGVATNQERGRDVERGRGDGSFG